MLATFRYVAVTAFRDRLLAALVGTLALVLLVASYLDEMALAEGQALKLAYAGAASRLVLVLGLIVFISFHVRRLYETREIETILSRPIGRASFLLGYAGGLALAALALVLPVGAVLWLAGGDPAGVALWTLSQALECLIVVALGLFCAVILESAVAASLAAFAFYALARLATFFLDIGTKQAAGDPSLFGQVLAWTIKALSLLMPRLDLFGQTGWLVYGPDPTQALLPLAQAAVYLPLLLAAALVDLRRKRF